VLAGVHMKDAAAELAEMRMWHVAAEEAGVHMKDAAAELADCIECIVCRRRVVYTPLLK